MKMGMRRARRNITAVEQQLLDHDRLDHDRLDHAGHHLLHRTIKESFARWLRTSTLILRRTSMISWAIAPRADLNGAAIVRTAVSYCRASEPLTHDYADANGTDTRYLADSQPSLQSRQMTSRRST